MLCDRFTDATFAYQGGGRGFDSGCAGATRAWVQQGRQPDLTLWFDLAAGSGGRTACRGACADRFERQDEAFFARVRDGYAQRMARPPQRFVRVDAAAERDAVWAQIAGGVEQRPWW